jgi:hypothetical protein
MSFKLSLLSVLVLAPSLAFAYPTAKQFDDQLINGKRFDLSGRYERGELDARLVDYHTDDNASPAVLNMTALDANHRELRKFVLCATQPAKCGALRGKK